MHLTSFVFYNACFYSTKVARIKTRAKPATKAGKRMMFGELLTVKAKPAKKVWKAVPVATLKAAI